MILDSRVWILDCGLKQHESYCRKPARGEGFLVNSPHEGERTGPPTLWYLGKVDGP